MSAFPGCVMGVRLFVFILTLKIAPISFYFSLYLFQFLLFNSSKFVFQFQHRVQLAFLVTMLKIN